jgi:hypothetical protein
MGNLAMAIPLAPSISSNDLGAPMDFLRRATRYLEGVRYRSVCPNRVGFPFLIAACTASRCFPESRSSGTPPATRKFALCCHSQTKGRHAIQLRHGIQTGYRAP